MPEYHLTQSRSPSAPESERLVVAYTGEKIRYRLRQAVPAFLFFVALLAVYVNDDARRFFSKGRDEPAAAAGFVILGGFIAAPLLDMIATFRRGRPALIVGRDGVEGPVFYRRRRFGWTDIADVFEKGGELLIELKPKNALQALSARYAIRGSHRRLPDIIRTPLACVDKSAAEIRAALRNCVVN